MELASAVSALRVEPILAVLEPGPAELAVLVVLVAVLAVLELQEPEHPLPLIRSSCITR